MHFQLFPFRFLFGQKEQRRLALSSVYGRENVLTCSGAPLAIETQRSMHRRVCSRKVFRSPCGMCDCAVVRAEEPIDRISSDFLSLCAPNQFGSCSHRRSLHCLLQIIIAKNFFTRCEAWNCRETGTFEESKRFRAEMHIFRSGVRTQTGRGRRSLAFTGRSERVGNVTLLIPRSIRADLLRFAEAKIENTFSFGLCPRSATVRWVWRLSLPAHVIWHELRSNGTLISCLRFKDRGRKAIPEPILMAIINRQMSAMLFCELQTKGEKK